MYNITNKTCKYKKKSKLFKFAKKKKLNAVSYEIRRLL
jgi:hypothetical protein